MENVNERQREENFDDCVNLPSLPITLDTVVVAMGTKVVGFTARSGDRLWTTDLPSETERQTETQSKAEAKRE